MAQFLQAFTIFSDTITIDPITAAAGSNFTVSGTITGYPTAPALSYQDDGGTPIVLGAANITATSYSFSHPPMTAGNHTFSIGVTGDPRITTASYSISGASTPGPVVGIAVLRATYNSMQLSFTPPAASATQTLTYNCNLGTTGLSGPFPITYTGLSASTDLFSGLTFIILPGLTRNTNYYCQISAVAPGNLIGTAATGGPFLTPQPTIRVNPITATVGSPFEVSGTIS